MEKQNYREGLADDLKKLREMGDEGKSLASDLLSESEKTDEYQNSKHEHLQDNVHKRIDKLKTKGIELGQNKERDDFLSRYEFGLTFKELSREQALEKVKIANEEMGDDKNKWSMPDAEILSKAIRYGLIKPTSDDKWYRTSEESTGHMSYRLHRWDEEKKTSNLYVTLVNGRGDISPSHNSEDDSANYSLVLFREKEPQ